MIGVLDIFEIGTEHHLGMTCDPIGGLVQVPCIELSGVGAVKAISATMWQTGRDMQTRYKETSLAGLAAHVPEC